MDVKQTRSQLLATGRLLTDSEWGIEYLTCGLERTQSIASCPMTPASLTQHSEEGILFEATSGTVVSLTPSLVRDRLRRNEGI